MIRLLVPLLLALLLLHAPAAEPWWSALPRPGWAPFERVELPEDAGWFEVYRVAPGTWALAEPGQWQEVISWLIEGEERALLFDTGLGIGDVRALAEALTDRELVVLNSHSHYDHVGGNHRFEAILGPGGPFAARNAEGGTHEAAVAEVLAEGAVWKALPEDFDRAAYRTRPWTVTETVVDGQVLDLGGRRLEVLATPGHAPDALCLLDAQARILFTGDTLYPAPLYAHLGGADFDAYRRSMARLATLADRVDLLATGHNEPVRGGEHLVEVHEAFEAVAAGAPPDAEQDGVRRHDFGWFSLLTAAP